MSKPSGMESIFTLTSFFSHLSLKDAEAAKVHCHFKPIINVNRLRFCRQ